MREYSYEEKKKIEELWKVKNRILEMTNSNQFVSLRSSDDLRGVERIPVREALNNNDSEEPIEVSSNSFYSLTNNHIELRNNFRKMMKNLLYDEVPFDELYSNYLEICKQMGIPYLDKDIFIEELGLLNYNLVLLFNENREGYVIVKKCYPSRL